MSSVTVHIYVEGGGEQSGKKRELRNGMDVFLGELKDAALAKDWKWNLNFCGDRNRTYKAFKNARDNPKGCEIVILLVDAEDPVTSPTVAEHLRNQHLRNQKENRKEEKWILTGVPTELMHLMVQTMETWIVADRDALSTFYGPGFRPNALPSRQNLEEEAKTEVKNALNRATEKTEQKGRYHKILHASQLLKMIDPEKVRRRCQHCRSLFDFLGAAIEAG